MVSKRLRNKTMKILCNFYKDCEPFTYITTKYLFQVGFPKTKNMLQVLFVLKSLGYVELKNLPDGADYKVCLTDKGRCYFEVSSDNKRDFWVKSIATPVLVSLATNLVINGIKLLLPLILG